MLIGEALNVVEVTIERVTAIANSSLPSAESEVHSSTKDFRSMPVKPADFSEVPPAQTLGEHHEAARQVFGETVDGVLADLQDFRDKLLQCMHDHQAADDNAQSVLLALGKSYRKHHYHSDRNYVQSRKDQGHHLGTPQEASGSQQDSGAHHDGASSSSAHDAPTGTGTTRRAF